MYPVTGSDGHVKVTTEGSERLTITSAGLVGINHTTSGASTNAPLTIQNSTGSSATRFNLVNSGSSAVESTQIYSQNNLNQEDFLLRRSEIKAEVSEIITSLKKK